MGRDNPARWAVLVVGAVVGSLLEMLGAATIYILLSGLVAAGEVVSVPLLGDLDASAVLADAGSMTVLIALTACVFAARGAYQVAYTYTKHRLALNAGARLSARLADGYLRLPYEHHLQRRSSELVRNAQQTVVDLAQTCFLQVIVVVAEALVIAGLLLVMLIVAPVPTLLAVVVLGGTGATLYKVVQPRLRDFGEEAQLHRSSSLAALQEPLTGILDIKAAGAIDYFSSRYRAAFDRLARAIYWRGTLLELPRLIIETALIFYILGLFAVGLALDRPVGEVLATLGLIAYAGLRIQPSMQKLIAGLNSVRFSAAALDDLETDIRLIEALPRLPAAERIRLSGAIRLEGLSYRYPGVSKPALQDVDLTVTRGELIGICGPTGGGKSTLVRVLMGLLPPTSGRMTVDGEDVAATGERWLSSVGVIPQGTFLLDDTLRRNVAFGIPDGEIDDLALEAAIAAAQLEDVVDGLEDGIETVVGEHGARLSGGQRQRVAIARALYRDPDMLVLDEATSALDTSTEALVMNAIARISADRTTIMVAHRLSTLRRCDRILVIEEGRITAIGTFDALEQESRTFAALLHSSAGAGEGAGDSDPRGS